MATPTFTDAPLPRFEVRSADALLKLLDNGEIALWEWHLKSNENIVTPAWGKQLGYSLESLHPIDYATFVSLVHPDDRLQVADSVQAHISGTSDKYAATFRMQHAKGHWIWIKAQGQIIERDANGEAMIMSGIHLDISQLKAVEAELRVRSSTDQMTGWFNRGHFLHDGNLALQRAQRQQTRLALIMFDIDHFKRVNDQYGHATGDAVIQRITQAVGERVRAVDLAARLGGEEFAVLLEGASLGDARKVAEIARERIAELTFYSAEQAPFTVTASFGATMLEDSDTSIETLLNRADLALYKAKANGRNRTELA